MSDTKEYWVRLPLAGVLAVRVDADNEEDAIQKALSTDWHVDLTSKSNDAELDELDVYEKTVEGNINYTPLWNAEAEEI